MDNEPFTGKFDGTQLTIVAHFRDNYPNAGCGRTNLVLKKTGNGTEFEGRIPTSNNEYHLTLRPS